MGAFVQQAEIIARELDVSVMAIHHSGKDWSRGMRGSSALLGAADAVWQLAPGGPRRLIVDKLKDDIDGGEVPFTLERFDLGFDRDNDPISSCVVLVGDLVSSDEAAEARNAAAAAPGGAPDARPVAPALTGGMSEFLEQLARAVDRHGAPRSRSRTIPAGTKAVLQARLESFSDIVVTASSRKSRQSQIARFVRTLEEHGLVARHTDHVWVTEAGELTLASKKAVDQRG